MKNLINNFRTQPLHNKVLAVVYLLIALAMPFIIGMKPAHAQSGDVYAVPQVQAAGDTYEAVVLQVFRKEAEPSFQARAGWRRRGFGAQPGACVTLGYLKPLRGEHRGSGVGGFAGGAIQQCPDEDRSAGDRCATGRRHSGASVAYRDHRPTSTVRTGVTRASSFARRSSVFSDAMRPNSGRACEAQLRTRRSASCPGFSFSRSSFARRAGRPRRTAPAPPCT